MVFSQSVKKDGESKITDKPTGGTLRALRREDGERTTIVRSPKPGAVRSKVRKSLKRLWARNSVKH